MMRFLLLSLLVTLGAGAAYNRVFRVYMEQLGTSGVGGQAVVFVASDGVTVAYAGFSTNLEPSLTASNCTLPNGKMRIFPIVCS